jgi:hypothetical protein
LRKIAEDIRLEAEDVRIELEEHMREHGC